MTGGAKPFARNANLEALHVVPFPVDGSGRMGSESRASATMLRLFVDALDDLGVPWNEVLLACGVEPALLHDPEAQIPQTSFERILETLAESTGDPCIGLHAGARFHPRAVNIFGYLLLSSATLGEGIRRTVEWYRQTVSSAARATVTAGGNA